MRGRIQAPFRYRNNNGKCVRRPQPQQVDTRIGTVKLQVTNRSGVTLDAIRLGIIDPD